MFSAIKSKALIVLSSLLVACAAVIKILMWSNSKKDKKIDTLEKNTKVLKRVNKLNIVRAKFQAKQKQKVESVNNENTLDNLDEQRGGLDANNNKTTVWKSVNR